MKPSIYNKFYTVDEDQIIAYNILSGAIAPLTHKQYVEIKQILDQGTNSCNTMNNSYVSFLVEGRFLIDDAINELDILKSRYLIGTLTQDKFGVTIMPTLDCNFKCIYCFIDHKKEAMNCKVQDNLVEWVRYQMKHRRLLEVGWFGGEPLLYLNTIRELTGRLKKVCKEMKCEYKAEMSSNGYLLNRNVIRELKKLSITQIQVSLDGPSRIHDRRRPLAGGGPTFNVILSNLIDIVNEGGIKLLLKPVVDRENADGIYELLEILIKAGIHDKISFNPQNTQPSPANNLSCLGSAVPEVDEFADIRADILIAASKKGFRVVPPQILCQACPSHNINSFLVLPDGQLYKCGSFLRPKDCIGYLDPKHPEKAHINFTNFWKWVGYDPFEDKQCRECEVLPLCMGGCMALREEIGDKDGHCIYYRYKLEKEIVGRYGHANASKRTFHDENNK